MDGNQFDAAASPPAAPFDLNAQRAIGERTPENQPFVYSEAFNNAIRLAFVCNLMINAREGTEDRLPTNMERVRLLSERPPPEVQEAPREYQISGQPRLAASIQGYTDHRGRQMYSLP